MKRTLALAIALAGWLPALPAAARDFVIDQAQMFSPSAVAAANDRIGNFNAQTGKDVVVVTVASLGGQSLQTAAANAFTQQNVDGVLIFIAKDDRRDIIVPDRAGAQWFTPSVLAGIRHSMESQFRAENYDAGLSAAVDGVLGVYREHLGSLRGGSGTAGVPAATGRNAPAFGGFHLSMFWWIIIAVIGFLLLRSILRAMSRPRYYGGGPAGPGVPPGSAPPPGYGPGYGYGGGGFGGGGSFWSGLLGGLGGAWLGNEMFGQRGGGIASPADAATPGPVDASGGGWGGGDAGGWQADAGQADMSGASGGDWGGGGFGDMGGGFGGGDMGGGW